MDSYSTKCFYFIQKCTKIVSVWGSAPDPAGRAYSAPPYSLACFKLELRKGPKSIIRGTMHIVEPIHQILAKAPSFGLYLNHITCFFFWKKVIHDAKKCIILKCTKIAGSWGFSPDPTGEFTTLSKDIYSWIWLGSKTGPYPSSAKSLIRHWEKINFRLNYTADCTVSSMNFQKFSGEGLTEPSPQIPSPAQYRASLLIRASTSNLWRFAPSVWAWPSIHPNMFDYSPNRGELDKIFWPYTSTSWLRYCGL